MTLQKLEKEVQRRLAELDHQLILDKAWSSLGYVYYRVIRLMEDGSEPFVVCDWRNGGGPLPLSEDIVSQVRSQEGDITEAIRQATVNNAVKKEKERQARDEALEELSREFHRSNASKL
jgi:hypothetical protein